MTPNATETARCPSDYHGHLGPLGHLGRLAPPDLIAAARRLGVRITLDDVGGVRLRAAGPPPPELLAALRDRKKEIASTLRAAAAVTWRNSNPPPPTPEGVCVHCGAEGADLPVLAGDGGHRWLHHQCWHAWQAARQSAAEASVGGWGGGHER